MKFKIKNKIYILLLLVTLVSCNKTRTIEEILITGSDEYWTYYSPSPYAGDFTYYKFGKDNFSQRYERDRNSNRFYKYGGEGDVMEVQLKWDVSQDSILRFNGFVYDVVSYNENCITLYYKDQNSKNERMFFLTKENSNNPRNYSGFYSERRALHPEKYAVPDLWWSSK